MKKIFSKIVLIFVLLIGLFACEIPTSNFDYELEFSKIEAKIDDEILTNINLPKTSGFATVEWVSSNPDVIDSDGKVNRQKEDVEVILSCRISYEGISQIFEKKVIVKKIDTIENEYDLIKDVLTTESGTYQVSGEVVAVNRQSFLVSDGSGSILVYKGSTWQCDVKVGDIVKLDGDTTTYGGSVQFGQSTKYEVIDTKEVTYGIPEVFNGYKVNEYVAQSQYKAKYVEIEGVLQVNGTYFNFAIDNASVMGSISYPFNEDELTELNGSKIKVTGYLTSVSGNGSYLNIIVTKVSKVEIVIPDGETAISQILNSELGTYKTRGKVIGINAQSFIVSDLSKHILVYKGSTWQCDVKVGDIVTLTGTTTIYGNSVQFGQDSVYEVISHDNAFEYGSPIEVSNNDISQYYYADKVDIEYVEIVGTLISSGNYYNLEFAGLEYVGSITYPLDPSALVPYYNKLVKVRGYVTSTRGVYLMISYTNIELAENENPSNILDLHILEFNDTHGYILQDENGMNGLSNAAYLVNQIRNANPKDDVVLVANGDMFQGTAISNITKGLSVIEAMNVMGFDCMGFGNHEFDWGIAEVIKYFDGDKSNGEANFPLLNTNIFNKDQTLVLDDNIVKSTVLEKEGIKVGIIGFIGDVYNSINYSVVRNYYFDDNINLVKDEAINLKNQGVDVIVVSVHGGNSRGVESYNVNTSLANLSYNGDYLIDAIINGHTHSYQTGYISRNGVKVPVVQGGSNGEAFGDLTLTINLDTKDVIDCNSLIYNTYNAYNNYDENVEKVIDENLEKYDDLLNEVYTVSDVTITSTSAYYSWIGSVLCKGTGADISICNTGGVRATGDVVKGGNITLENMYMINPFDNFIVLVKLTGSEAKEALSSSGYIIGGLNKNSLDNSKIYTVAVVDYVYYKSYFPQKEDAVVLNWTMRDLLIEDLRLRDTFNPISDYESKLTNLVD